jgi:hypothetical protein
VTGSLKLEPRYQSQTARPGAGQRAQASRWRARVSVDTVYFHLRGIDTPRRVWGEAGYLPPGTHGRVAARRGRRSSPVHRQVLAAEHIRDGWLRHAGWGSRSRWTRAAALRDRPSRIARKLVTADESPFAPRKPGISSHPAPRTSPTESGPSAALNSLGCPNLDTWRVSSGA